MSQKSFNGKPALYLVPTPIGNLEDITFRSIRILNEVNVVFSEDTRTTKILLEHYKIDKKTISSHKFNEQKSSEKMLQYLKKGLSIALVSDRGTPLISDPGKTVVKTILEQGYSVISLPGATALIPAITSSGLNTDKFIFNGFLDSKQQKRRKEIEELSKNTITTIIYEAPHRIIDTLNDLKEIIKDRKICVAREISKKHEEIYRGTAEDILKEIISPKGEFVIVIEGIENNNNYENLSIIEHVNLYIKEGKLRNEAMKLVAKDRNVSKSIIYKEYLEKGK